MIRPPPEHVEALRAAAVAIADGDMSVSYREAFRLKQARAYVWGVYTGEDPRLSLCRVRYGEAAVAEARREGVLAEWIGRQGHNFDPYLKGIERMRLTIPRLKAAA